MGMPPRGKNGKFKKKGGAKKKASSKKKTRAKKGTTRAKTTRAKKGRSGLEARVSRLETNVHHIERATVQVVNLFRKGAKMGTISHVPGYITPTGKRLGKSLTAKQLGAG